MLDILGLATLLVAGFTASAEFGSYALVHPVIRRLPAHHHIAVEQGLLRTFGRVMPVLMAASVILAIANASFGGGEGGPALWRWLAAGALGAATVSTLIFNVPINIATGRWDPESPPPGWKQTRDRWEVAQAVRSWLLLIGFVLVAIGFAA